MQERLAWTYKPEEINAMVFTKKETAEVIFGKKVTHAVVTVPANFNDDDLTEREIDEIVPVGVSTRIPMGQSLLPHSDCPPLRIKWY